MVCDTVKPNLRDASCCRVEVVNGGAGDFFTGGNGSNMWLDDVELIYE